MGKELHELDLFIDLFALFLYNLPGFHYLQDNIFVVSCIASVTLASADSTFSRNELEIVLAAYRYYILAVLLVSTVVVVRSHNI